MTVTQNLLFTLLAACAVAALQAPRDQIPLQAPKTADVKVPVTLGVMSRCPDALICESVFDRVLMRVSDQIDLSLTFLGTLNSSDSDFGVTCMHGPDECAGNVQELCAMKYAPTPQWWEFVHCQNYQGRDNIGLSETALKCANAAQFDWEESGIGACVGMDGSGKAAEGVQLLKDSVTNTASLNVTKSCTILINNKQVCVHDSEWKECEGGHTAKDFVKQIRAEYQKLNGEDDEGEDYD